MKREKNRHICINFRISINYHVLCGFDKAKFPINIKCASVIGNYHMQAKWDSFHFIYHSNKKTMKKSSLIQSIWYRLFSLRNGLDWYYKFAYQLIGKWIETSFYRNTCAFDPKRYRLNRCRSHDPAIYMFFDVNFIKYEQIYGINCFFRQLGRATEMMLTIH